MSKIKIMSNRRRFLGQLGAGASLVTLGGCDAFDGVLGLGHPALGFLRKANALTMGAQRAIQGPATMAREYPPSAIRQDQRPNGSTDPQTDDYLAVQKDDFAGYRLQVTGLVDKPLSLSLNELRQMPSRTQITRHDCVEGWSCIAQWTGVQLSRVLDRAGIKPAARYVVFHCYDSMDDTLGDDSTLTTRASISSVPIIRRRSSPTDLTGRRCRLPTARHCVYASSSSSATRWLSTSEQSKSSTASPRSPAATVAIGKTEVTIGMQARKLVALFGRYIRSRHWPALLRVTGRRIIPLVQNDQYPVEVAMKYVLLGNLNPGGRVSRRIGSARPRQSSTSWASRSSRSTTRRATTISSTSSMPRTRRRCSRSPSGMRPTV